MLKEIIREVFFYRDIQECVNEDVKAENSVLKTISKLINGDEEKGRIIENLY
ncbi:MAG: hypothetical protein IJA34_03145 [Lachnospiraceae bacterium]|nr:hypothetical protein [Lachnospiraceae bacterium]